MTKERAHEICFLIVQSRVIKGGLPSPEAYRREIGNLAKEINVPQHELRELTRMFLPKLIGDMFGYPVSID